MRSKTIVPKKLNLLYLAECVSFHSTRGDIIHVSEVVEEFVRKGNSVTLLIRGKHTPSFFKNHLLTLRLSDFHFPKSLFLYFWSFIAISFRVLIKRPDVIYVRDNGLNLGLIIGNLVSIPVFLEINGDLSLEYSYKSNVMSRMLKISLRNSYSLADTIILPMPRLHSVLESLNIDTSRTKIIPNGVNHRVFYPKNKFVCREELNLGKNSFYLCFVGNLAPWQGVENAILALSKLYHESIDVDLKLIIVGNGPEEIKLKRLTDELKIADKVIFTGVVSHNGVANIVNACDVCVAPFTAWRNRKVGVSALKIYEYLSCGKPVIISSLPGTEIIEKLDAGILVEPDNVQELKNAIQKAIKMLPYWERRSFILHKEIAENYSWDCRVNDILRIIEQVLNKRASLGFNKRKKL
ncbi:MAG: glycosyltransferase family 4 protein [Candidatus Bathyarchaeia archaeon]|jgi:glycosyltransferase involved in cell wall biosynthesis